MTATIFDIETTAIDDWHTLRGLDKIHCIVTRTGKEVKTYSGDSIDEGVEALRTADVIVGHNSIGFDIPAIKKLYPGWDRGHRFVGDTLVMARLVWPNRKELDFRIDDFPKNMIGSHSLKSWGVRLGENKAEYEGGWDEFTDEMLDYCVQDTLVTQRLWDEAHPLVSCESMLTEHRFAEILSDQSVYGFRFDVEKASRLYAELADKRDILHKRLVDTFPPVHEEMKTPAYWFVGDKRYKTKAEAVKSNGLAKDVRRGPNRVKETPFNPDSRQQIANCLIDKYGWSPESFTPGGQPKVDETILKAMPFDEAKLLVDYLTLSKRLGQLSEGNEAWLKLETGGRIHGFVNHNGTVTGRCTHRNPNMAQVPSCSAPYGEECRSLFMAPKGRMLVGVDASGLELRCLAHYLSRWDRGRYAEIICSGDIHTANQKAAGLATRDQAKTFIYGLIFGAGAQKFGSIVGGGVKDGQRMMSRFLTKIPALKRLRETIKETLKGRDHLIGLDGRKIPIRSNHSALNALLQSAGAVVMKRATIRANLYCEGLDVHQVAHVHDEIQYEAVEKDAQEVGNLAVCAIRDAGKDIDFRCPLDGEYKIGRTWAETH